MKGYFADHYLSQFFDDVGDGSGSHDGAVNTGTFKLTPPAGKIYGIDQLVITVEDDATIIWDGYGANPSALTNGVLLRVMNDITVELDLLNGEPIKRNFDWSRFMSRFSWHQFTTNDLIAFHLVFVTRLIVAEGRHLEFKIQDDLSSLVNHTCLAWGVIDDVPVY